MFIFRFIALIFIAIALMILGADVVQTLENAGKLSLHSLADLFNLFTRGTQDVQPATGGLAGVLNTALSAPAFAVAGAIGLILAFLFRQRA